MRKEELHEGRKYAISGYDRKAGALLTKIGSRYHTFIAPDDGRTIRRSGRDIHHEWTARDDARMAAAVQAHAARADIEARLAVVFEDIPPRERNSILGPQSVYEIKVHSRPLPGEDKFTFMPYLRFEGREAVERVLAALDAAHKPSTKEITPPAKELTQ